MPTKPLQIAFWSLFVGFIPILALTLPRVDTQPMTIIAGVEPSTVPGGQPAREHLPESNRPLNRQPSNRLGTESDEMEYQYASLPPEPRSTLSTNGFGPAATNVSMTKSSSTGAHEGDSDTESPDSHIDRANRDRKESDPLIEIGTIVIPSLGSQRATATMVNQTRDTRQDAEFQLKLQNLEKRLEALQQRLDRLLTSQVEMQTSELETVTKLVDQMQNDRKIQQLERQLRELQEEREQLKAVTRGDSTSPQPDVQPSARDAFKIDAVQIDEEPRSTDATQEDSRTTSPPLNASDTAQDTTQESEQDADETQNETKPTDESSARPKVADTRIDTGLKESEPSPRNQFSDPIPRDPDGWNAATPKPSPTRSARPEATAAPIPAIDDTLDESLDDSDSSSRSTDLVPPAESEIPSREVEITVPVPSPDELDVAPFDVDSPSLPKFKLRKKIKSRSAVQPESSTETDRFLIELPDEPTSEQSHTGERDQKNNAFDSDDESSKIDGRSTINSRQGDVDRSVIIPPTVAPSNTPTTVPARDRDSDRSTDRIDNRDNDLPAQNPNFLIPPETSQLDRSSRSRQPTPVATSHPTHDTPDLLANQPPAAGDFRIETKILHVRLAADKNRGIEWGRLQNQEGHPLVDFSPTSVNTREDSTGMIVGLLRGEVETLHQRLRQTNHVDVISERSHPLMDRQPSLFSLGIEEPPRFDRWAPPAPGEATDTEEQVAYDEEPLLWENATLTIIPEAVDGDRIRLELQASGLDGAQSNQTATLTLENGTTVVWSGLIFEQPSTTDDEHQRESRDSILDQLPLLGRKKSERSRNTTERIERVILLTVYRDNSSTHLQTVMQAAKPIPRKADEKTTPVRDKRLSGREFEQAMTFYQEDLFGPALEHVEKSLEHDPENRLALQLKEKINSIISSPSMQRRADVGR